MTVDKNPVILRKGLRIGYPDAETDDDYVFSCFIDNGIYYATVNTNDQGSILLGRTGSGKSAIIRRIKDKENNVIVIDPESLSFNYLYNSQIMKFFEDAGVSLEAFYNLLWKHIFAVELLKKKYNIKNDDAQKAFMYRFASVFTRDRAKEKAVKYLQEWGEKFWNETEYRVKEFTEKLEGDLKAEISTASPAVKAAVGSSMKMSEEVKSEVVHRGQKVVNSIQIKDLHDVIKLLSEEVFTDSLDRYYICIDRLDDEWVNDDIRFKLLRSLIESIRSFRSIQTVKIVVALRTDLYFSMLRRIISPGFQEEKYDPYLIRIKWSRENLREMIDLRVSELFRRQYTRDGVKAKDIFSSENIDKNGGLDYIIDRTFFRPRETIAFMNKCLERGAGKSKITASMIREIEPTYSTERFQALCSEWRREYPQLRQMCKLIQGGPPEFSIHEISVPKIEECANLLFDIWPETETGSKTLCENTAMDGTAYRLKFCGFIFSCLYQTGVIGVKLLPSYPRMWSFEDDLEIDPTKFATDTKISVHKTFYASLNIKFNVRAG